MWHRSRHFATTHNRLQRRELLKRAMIAGVSLTGAGSLLQGCNTNENAIKRSLNFGNWASAETATRNNIDKALLAFEKQNNVQVNNIGMPFDEVLTQITELIHANITLDVMELSGNLPYVLAGMGALAALDPFVPRDWFQDAFPESFAAGTYKGVLYAVPFSITPHGFWYNKTLLTAAKLDPAHPPQRMNDLNEMLALLRSKLPADSYPIGLDISATEYALIGFWPWIWTFGGNPLIDAGEGKVIINWADDGTIAAFQWLQDAVRKRWTPPDLAIKAERELMAEEKIVFKLDGPYLTGILGTINPAFSTVQQVNETFGVTTTPHGPRLVQAVTCADIHNLSIASTASNRDLAWKLINFLTTSPEVITTFLIPEGGMLPRESYDTQTRYYSRFYADAISQAFIQKIIPTMRPPVFGPRYSQAAMAIVTALQEISQGMAVKPRLLALTDEVKAIYAQDAL